MNLHSRMKQYEAVSQTYLMRRTPVIIRLDGVAFHTFTKNFDKPLDEPFAEAMRWVTRHLVNNIQGCLMGYTQSDDLLFFRIIRSLIPMLGLDTMFRSLYLYLLKWQQDISTEYSKEKSYADTMQRNVWQFTGPR